jgi:hypothetical protein
MLPGVKMRTVFTSRWKALYWSLGVMVTAYCTIPSGQSDDTTDIDAVATQQDSVAVMDQKPINKWTKPTHWQGPSVSEKSQNPIVGTEVMGKKVTQEDVDKLKGLLQ